MAAKKFVFMQWITLFKRIGKSPICMHSECWEIKGVKQVRLMS